MDGEVPHVKTKVQQDGTHLVALASSLVESESAGARIRTRLTSRFKFRLSTHVDSEAEMLFEDSEEMDIAREQRQDMARFWIRYDSYIIMLCVYICFCVCHVCL